MKKKIRVEDGWMDGWMEYVGGRDVQTETKWKETNNVCLNTFCTVMGCALDMVLVPKRSYKTSVWGL